MKEQLNFEEFENILKERLQKTKIVGNGTNDELYVGLPENLLSKCLSEHFKNAFLYLDREGDIDCSYLNGVRLFSFKQMRRLGVMECPKEDIEDAGVVAILFNVRSDEYGNIFMKDSEFVKMPN